MSDLRKYIKRQMQNPEFKEEYERTRAEYEVTRALIEARLSPLDIQRPDGPAKASPCLLGALPLIPQTVA